MKTKITYLAIPFTFDPERSFRLANKLASYLMLDGHVVFSPISHSFPIAKQLPKHLVTDHDFWMKQDLTILKKCDKLVVVDLIQGGKRLIEESRGVQKEIEFAKENGIEIEYWEHVID